MGLHRRKNRPIRSGILDRVPWFEIFEWKNSSNWPESHNFSPITHRFFFSKFEIDSANSRWSLKEKHKESDPKKKRQTGKGDESNYKVGILKGLPGANTRLFLFEADINDPDTFRPAIEGCEFIFLVATPLKHDPLNSKFKDTTEASLNGIHTILKFCEQSGTVRRVVYTGSVTATSPWKEDFTGYKDFIDESNWTTIDLPYPHYTDHLKGYTGSKTLSEKEILKYNKEGEGGLEVVSLNCALVGGDTILPYTPDSVLLIVSPLTGIELYHTSLKFLQGLLCSVPLVHIDDVCEAHIFCIERSVMAGRFLCAVDCPTMKDFVDYFAEKFSDLKLIKEVEGEGKRVKGCSQKLIDLGFKYNFGVEEILSTSVECAKRLGGL